MLHDLMPKSQLRNVEQQSQNQQQKNRNQQHAKNQHHHRQQQQPEQQQQQQRQHYQEPRWKFCVQSTKSVFAMELSSLYMKSFKPSHLKRIAHDVSFIMSLWLNGRVKGYMY